MVNIKRWMAKVGERLKAITVTYKDYSTTTGTSLYQGYYFGNIEGVAISGKSLIGVTVVSAQDNTPAFCAMLTNNIIRAYSTVASKTVTIRCIYLGGVISYLIHLTESLKSFCGRRWAYAEHQEVADKAVRTDKLSLCRDLCRESKYSSESDKVDNNLDTRQREGYRNLRLVFLSNRPQYVQRATSRGRLFGCLAESHKCGTDDKHKSVLYRGRLTTIPGEGVMAC